MGNERDPKKENTQVLFFFFVLKLYCFGWEIYKGSIIRNLTNKRRITFKVTIQLKKCIIIESLEKIKSTSVDVFKRSNGSFRETDRCYRTL